MFPGAVFSTPYSRRHSKSTYNDNPHGDVHGGIKTGAMSDSGRLAPTYGLGMLDSLHSWTAKHQNEDEWYELDLGYAWKIAGIRIQGGAGDSKGKYVRGVSVYVDGVKIKRFGEALDGTTQDLLFDSVAVGQKLRLTNFKFNGKIAMRVDALGKLARLISLLSGAVW